MKYMISVFRTRQRHLSIPDLTLDILRYYATVNKSNISNRGQNVRPPYSQNAAIRKLQAQYFHSH